MDAWCRLRRQRDGEVLVLDGVGDIRVIDDVMVTTVPIEDGADVADGVQEQARMVLLDVIVSDTPLVRGVRERGARRLDAVLAYLDDSVGELLTLTTRDRPTYRDLLLMSRGSPVHDARARASRLTLPLRETIIVTSRDTLTQGSAASAVAAGASAEDRGDAATADKTLAKTGADALAAILGF